MPGVFNTVTDTRTGKACKGTMRAALLSKTVSRVRSNHFKSLRHDRHY